MRPLIDIPMQSWCTIEDPSRSTLVNGGFEAGGTPPAGWSDFHVITTTIPGTRPGGSGSFVASIGYDGVNATGLLYQGALIVGAPYKLDGWYKNTGASIFVPAMGAAGAFFPIPFSAAWAPYSITDTCAGDVLLRLNAWAMAAGLSVELDDTVLTPLIARTPNVGSLGSMLQMGDGQLSATYPTRTQNTTAGFAFNGSQYLQWLSPVTVNTFTYSALVMRTGAAAMYLLDARVGGGAGRIYWDGANLNSGSGGTIYVDDVATTVLPYGQVCLVSVAGVPLLAPTKVVLGADQALANGWVGNVLGQQFTLGTATPRQLRDVKNRLMARCWK